MTDYDPTLKARFQRELKKVLPEPVLLSLENSFLVGPFENYDMVGFNTAYPPETNPGGAVDPGMEYAGKSGQVRWERAEGVNGLHAAPLKISDFLSTDKHSVVYYSAEVQASEPCAAQIAILSSGIAHAWVNGQLVMKPLIPDSANLEDASAWVALHQGSNRLLVKMIFQGRDTQNMQVQVKSFGAFEPAVDGIASISAGQGEPGVRLTSKFTLAELLGTAGDKARTQEMLQSIRQDPYATRWDTAWVEAVERQYQSSGQFAPFHDAAVAYQPVIDPHPSKEFWPQSPAASKDLLVVDVSESTPAVEFAMTVLQGLVNRQNPRLYLLHTRYARQDGQWLDELHFEGYTSRQISIDDAWKQFLPEVKGAVVYDGSIMEEIGVFHSDQLNQTNVVMMICALEDAIPLTPEMNQAFSLPVVFDARGRWTGQYDMMHWAYQTLFPRMNQQVLATNYPGIFLLTDYLVSFKIFTFWFPEFRTIIEENLLRGILASTPPNRPILGWWFDWMPNVKDPKHHHADAVMEGQGVVRGSVFGKFLTPSHEATNLTIHSGVPLSGYRHKTPDRPEFDPSKVYYTFMISDGDNMGEALMMRTRDIQWDKPERGSFPMGWSFAPATSRLAPPVLNYYLRTAAPNDILMGGLGVAYTEPRVYLRAFPDQFEALWAEYARDTDQALRWIDSTVLWLINGRHEEADRYARGSSGQLRGIFIGYGGSPEIAEARITENNVVAFYPATRMHWTDNAPSEERINAMVEEIQAGVRQRPDFIEAWVLNWGLDMRMLGEVQRRLGPDYVCVRPDVLAEMRLLAK